MNLLIVIVFRQHTFRYQQKGPAPIWTIDTGCHTRINALKFNGHGRYCGKTSSHVTGPALDPLGR